MPTPPKQDDPEIQAAAEFGNAAEKFSKTLKKLNAVDRPSAPEEKGKTLEEELQNDSNSLRAHLERELSDLSRGQYDMVCNDLFGPEGFIERRDKLHSKHYARIEGEKRPDEELVEELQWALDQIQRLAPLRFGTRDIMGGEVKYQEARQLLARHTTSQPQGK